MADSLTTEAIFGLDFLEAQKCMIDTGQRRLIFKELGISLPIQRHQNLETTGSVTICAFVKQTLHLPAFTEKEVMAKTSEPTASGAWFLESTKSQEMRVAVASAVVSPTSGEVPIRILNPTRSPLAVYKGSKVASLEPLADSVNSVETSQSKPTVAVENTVIMEIVNKAGQKLSTLQRNKLFHSLSNYSEVFAQDKTDFGHTSKISHIIPTGDAQHVRQAVRRLHPQRREDT